MSRRKKQGKRLRRAEGLKRHLNVSAPMGRLEHAGPTGETFQVPAALLEKLCGGATEEGDRKKERRKLGAHHTPMAMAEEVVAKALYPHLLWMATDPDGWDRAHANRAPVQGSLPPSRLGAEERQQQRLAAEREAFRSDKIAGPLLVALEAAVPLWIEELRACPEETRIAEAHRLAQLVAEKGDILMYGTGKKDGKVAEVFNATAKGLAALAYQPGGVTWCGIHWEAT